LICPACGSANEAGRKFCGECGTSLATACPSCGTSNAPGTKFCGECGTALADAAVQSSAAGRGSSSPPVGADASAQPGVAAASAERRLVSVLFADLVGSTTLAEDRDPEETRTLLTQYFEMASDVLGRYGGTLEKFIGDAVMAVWGVPVAHEDDAERAVRAALDLVSAVSSITDAGQPLQLRAAVLTGEAAATIGAAGQGIVAGDLVNTASRLQSLAPPGTVLVGEATRRATAEAIAYEEVGDQLLKGKASPIAAWRAVSVLGMRGGARRRSALEAPFVGRDEELRLVKDLFHAAIRERKPRLVTIIGQAGIGKSRLGWEFEKYIDGVTQTAYWHAGRSPSYGEGISFWALAEMVRERAGIAESDPPEVAREKLTACLSEWLTDAEERRWVEPRLAGLLGLEEMPAGQREELFAAWRTFFERIADRDPVILVFKDLHWADAGLLEFIEHLLNWSRSHPIYVLAMTRPDLLERHPSWGTGVRNATTVVLEPLSDTAMGELLQGLVPGLPDDAVAAVVARAEGVPLYAVETIRMLIDRGQVVAADGGYRLDGPIDRLAVPESLHALVAARIDANTPGDRSVLADGAVLGQSFTLAAVSGIVGRSEDAVLPSLDRLVRRELLIRDEDPRSPERGQYRFVQAVVREVAYETLAKADRRAKHLAAARYFEALGDDELSGVLANHYLEALRATPAGPEADALAAQARIALRAAADRATALHAWTVAGQHLIDALDITTDPAELAALHLALAQTEEVGGLEHALQAAELASQLGDRGTENRARALAGQILVNRSMGVEALAILGPAAEGLGESEPNADRVFAELARLYMMQDRSEESVDMAEKALRAAAPERDTEVIVNALVTQGSAIGNLGRFDEAEAIMRGAMLLADKAGHVTAALRARNNLGANLVYEARVSTLLPLMNESVDLALRYGFAGWGAQHITSRMIAFISMGDWDGARSDLALIEDWDLSEVHAANRASGKALLAGATGETAVAERFLDEARDMLAKIDTVPQVTAVASGISLIHVLLGEWAAALTAVAGLEGGGNGPFICQYSSWAAAAAGDRGTIGVLLERSNAFDRLRVNNAIRAQVAASAATVDGRWDEGRAGYVATIAEYRELDYNLEAAILGLEFAAYLGDRFDDARAAGEAAETWFGERDASSVVERYRANFMGTPASPTGSGGTQKRAVPVDAKQRA
jgi:class 3 adenylate cyclase/tetratricopeptide (TPR) repeat protein